MNATSLLIALAIAMWLLQIWLGWRQLRQFNLAFEQVSQQGKVLVGRNRGRFRAKVIIVLVINEKNEVLDGFYMKGFSVFAKPNKFDEVIGLTISQIVPEQIFPQHQSAQQALQIAIKSV